MSFEGVGIVGAGTMGAGIATSLAQNGVTVRLVDTTQEAADRGLTVAHKFYAKAVEKGRMSQEDAKTASARLSAGANLSVLTDCDLVIEAVFEEFSVKAEMFARLNKILSSDAVVATNTSCLRVSDLAETVDNPARFLGMHYFNPAAINPIVEVIRGDKTDAALYDRCLQFCRNTGKRPLACKDSYGFAINRFFVPYANEAVRMLDEGVGSMAQMDRVARECMEVAAGPFVVMNLVRHHIMKNAQEHLAPHGPFYGVAKTLAENGRAEDSFDIGGDDSGTAESDAIIADRLRAATFFPVLQELDEGVASAADIDLGAKLALRFGKPPCALMDELGQAEVTRIVKGLTDLYGETLPKSLTKVGSLVG